MARRSVSQTLKDAIRDAGVSRYQISRGSGLSQSALSRFMSGERTLDLTSVDKLADYLGLELRSSRPSSARKRQQEKP